MRSRTLREGSVGLLILVGLAFLGGLILWIRGLELGRRSYRLTITFQDVSGMQIGAPVRYRGVVVGKVRNIIPKPKLALTEVEISSANVLIPRDSLIQSNQTGLIGETTIDITPRQELPPNFETNPLAEDCLNSAIFCNGERITGEIGVSFYALIGSTVELARLFANPELFENIQNLTANTSNAAASVANLAGRVSDLSGTVETELRTLSASANRTTMAAGDAATQIGLTAAEVNRLLASNRSAVTGTLNNINQTSNELRRIALRLSPVFEQGEFINNLETLSANAAQTSANLRSLSEELGSTENLLMLQETLDSARATFQNAQKITADLDELTGDPDFRRNLRNLVEGLNNLVSSSQQLQQQTAIAQTLSLPTEQFIPPAELVAPVLMPLGQTMHPARSAPSTSESEANSPVLHLSRDPNLRLRFYQETLAPQTSGEAAQ